MAPGASSWETYGALEACWLRELKPGMAHTPACACTGDPPAVCFHPFFFSALSLALQPVPCSRDWSVVGTALQT